MRLWRQAVSADECRDSYFRQKQKSDGVSKSDLGPVSSLERSATRLRLRVDHLLEEIPPPLAQEIGKKIRSFRLATGVEEAPTPPAIVPPDSDWLGADNFLVQVRPVRIRLGPKLSARELFDKFFRERVWEFPSSLSEERLREMAPGCGLWFWADTGGEEQTVWGRAIVGDFGSAIGPVQRPSFPAPALPAFQWRVPLKSFMLHSGSFRPADLGPGPLSKSQIEELCGAGGAQCRRRV